MIPSIRNILFATDLSKSARHAFLYAVSLANRFEASITLLHVMEEVSHSADSLLRDFLGEERWQNLNESRSG